eukprot:Rhum_TRINITY_DN21132_c0_g1::Rhum_TRINITY_DN21132_c0_g1_i1::g.173280::m.173280
MQKTPARLRTVAKWFDPPPAREKWTYCQAVCKVPGFPTDTPITKPYWLENNMSPYHAYNVTGPSVERAVTAPWIGDESKGIPKMPPVNAFGNRLIPRDELEKFMPDIRIDGLAEEIQGDIRNQAKHIVPHQFHEHFDTSMVQEGAKRNWGTDMARWTKWKANYALYAVRHPLAEDMQRKLLIGDAEAQDRYQDPDDVEYEREILDALRAGDADQAASLYKRLSDPPRNWEVYKAFVAHFAARGLLADAVAVYDEMLMLGVPPDGALIESLVDAAVAAENPVRAAWAAGEARRTFPGALRIPADQRARAAKKALKYLVGDATARTPATDALAVRVYTQLKADGLLGEADAVAAKAAELTARAAALGLLPSGGGAGEGGHHHRHAYSVRGGAADAGGADGAQPQPVRPVPQPVALTAEETATLEGLVARAAAEEDQVAPYFKKSKPNHVLQPGLCKEFDYALAAGSSSRMRAPSAAAKRDFVGTMADPQQRYTFRWAGPSTRMVDSLGKTTQSALSEY